MTDVAREQQSDRQPHVLLLYFTYTGQSLKVLEAAADVLRDRGCQVSSAQVEFTDPKFSKRFAQFPLRHVWRDMFSVQPAQSRKVTGEIRVPDEARRGDYDLVCIGSPTWWRDTSMPLRSYLESDDAATILAGKPFAVFVVCRRYWRENLETVRKLAVAKGGRFLDEIHFGYPGGQIRSMLSLTSFLGTGEYRDRYLGIRIPTTNVQPLQIEQTRIFAAELADRLFVGPPATDAGKTAP